MRDYVAVETPLPPLRDSDGRRGGYVAGARCAVAVETSLDEFDGSTCFFEFTLSLFGGFFGELFED